MLRSIPVSYHGRNPRFGLRHDDTTARTTIGVGLLLDTLVVRTFVLPSLIALLGRWFWWPTRVGFLTRRRGVNRLGGQRFGDDVGDLLDGRRAGSLREGQRYIHRPVNGEPCAAALIGQLEPLHGVDYL